METSSKDTALVVARELVNCSMEHRGQAKSRDSPKRSFEGRAQLREHVYADVLSSSLTLDVLED